MLGKYFSFPALFLALLALAAPVRAAAPSRFQVLYSNDVHGETEPCG